MIVHSAIAPCEECGVRCGTCDERMCSLFGPEPALACLDHPVCEDCATAPTCPECLLLVVAVAEDRAEQAAFDAMREA